MRPGGGHDVVNSCPRPAPVQPGRPAPLTPPRRPCMYQVLGGAGQVLCVGPAGLVVKLRKLQRSTGQPPLQSPGYFSCTAALQLCRSVTLQWCRPALQSPPAPAHVPLNSSSAWRLHQLQSSSATSHHHHRFLYLASTSRPQNIFPFSLSWNLIRIQFQNKFHLSIVFPF